MKTNIEIKARVHDPRAFVARAAALAGGEPEIIEQTDVFFSVQQGRLKLRILAPDRGELIQYERPDRQGPKASRYSVVPLDQPAEIRQALGAALGECGLVVKTRHLYLVGRTRIHLDEVRDLGWFMELEVVMNAGEDPAAGHAEAESLAQQLGVATSDLVARAYVDLLNEAAI